MHEEYPVPLSTDLSCSACAVNLWNPPQIFFLRVSSRMALVMTKLLKARRMWFCPFLWAWEDF